MERDLGIHQDIADELAPTKTCWPHTITQLPWTEDKREPERFLPHVRHLPIKRGRPW